MKTNRMEMGKEFKDLSFLENPIFIVYHPKSATTFEISGLGIDNAIEKLVELNQVKITKQYIRFYAF